MKRKKLLAAILMVCTVLGLAGCGGNTVQEAEITAQSETAAETIVEKDMTASALFAEEGIWYEVNSSSGIGTDTQIKAVYVFDGEGNVTYYDTDFSYYSLGSGTYEVVLTFGDLEGLSDEEIIALAAEKDEDSFDLWKEYVLSNYYGVLEWVTDETIIDDYTMFKDYYEQLEYEAPQAKPYQLSITADDTGNSAEYETLTYEADSLGREYGYQCFSVQKSIDYNWTSYGYTDDEFDDFIEEYETGYAVNEIDIKAKRTEASTVYSNLIYGYDYLVTIVDEDYEEVLLDQPGDLDQETEQSELIEVDETADDTTIMYQLYYNKITELKNEYGEAGVEIYSEGTYEHSFYYTGLCCAQLIDLDGNGAEELLVVYQTDDVDSATDSDESYNVEVWAYKEGEIEQIQGEYSLSYYPGYGEYGFAFVYIAVSSDGTYYLNRCDYSSTGALDEYYVYDGESMYAAKSFIYDVYNGSSQGADGGESESSAWQEEAGIETFYGMTITGKEDTKESVDSANCEDTILYLMESLGISE